MIPVKICGITNLEDAQAAVRSGASALGFIFYDKSPRYIPIETASQIAEYVQGKASLVGVFVDEALDNVNGIAKKIGLNFIQLHGNESIKRINRKELGYMLGDSFNPYKPSRSMISTMAINARKLGLENPFKKARPAIYKMLREFVKNILFLLKKIGSISDENKEEVAKQTTATDTVDTLIASKKKSQWKVTKAPTPMIPNKSFF